MTFFKLRLKINFTIFLSLLLFQFSYSQISAFKDNTLYQDLNGNLSNGAGSFFFSGVNNNGGVYRGLIAFDLSAIPSNATITNAILTLNMSRTTSGAQTISIHKVDTDWGEGSSDAGGQEGAGAASTTGDATWIHTFYNTSTWTNAGGDYNGTASASISVAGTGQYSWGSNASMIADVQSWIDTPSENYGWIIIGNEGANQTAKRFDSKENPNASNRPVLNVTYTTPNNPPQANNDNATTNEDISVNIDVLSNDEDDVSLDPSSVTVTNNPSNGSITNINTTTGVITYSPNEDYNGSDSFTYTVDDDEAETSNEATVSVTINSVNDAPNTSDDSGTTNEDNSVIVDVLNNDDDIDGVLDNSSVAIASAPANGSITNINTSTGAITYTPNGNYNGGDSFTYTVEDDSGDVSNSATVSITINPLNDAPTAINDTTAADEDNSVIVSVLSNDNDIDGSLVASTVNVVNDPTNGNISTINTSTGAITYMPDENYNGSDSFTYTVEDDSGSVSNTATVLININAVNDAPVATNDTSATNEDNSLIVAVLGNDNDIDGDLDPATVSVISDPANGTITGINMTTGAITYMPDSDYHGSDSFTYTVDDDGGEMSSEAMVLLTINSVNDNPVANNDTTSTSEETAVQYNVLFNDDDIDGTLNAASLLIVDDPGNGVITDINTTNGVITYLPDNNFNGEDSFIYTVQDDSGAVSNQATVVVTVSSVNDAPVANNDDAQTNEDTDIIVDVLNNDTDSDGTLDASSVSLITNPSNGSITNINTATGEITYSPNNNYNGSDSFTYSVRDNNSAASNQATVSITILSINDNPIANNDAANTDENTDVTINVLLNDSDIDGTLNINTVNIITDPQNGSAQIEEDGQITYTPQSSFNGIDSLVYTVNDDSGAVSNQAKVRISVGAVNDLPVAVADSAFTNEDESTQIDILANDFDSDGILIPATVNIINNPQNGSISTINQSSGIITYIPNADFFGSDGFTYTVKDDSNATSSETPVTITIHSVNDAPNAKDDSGSTNEETSLTINILENDQDIDGSLVASTIVTSDPENGSITNINSETGQITYLPDDNFSGPDEFSYTVQDDSGAVSNQALVSIDVQNINDEPHIEVLPAISFNEDDSLKLSKAFWFDFIFDDETADSSLDIQFIAGEFVHVVITDKQVTFSSPLNWFGIDTVNIVVSDGELTAQMSFPVTVFSINDIPYFAELADSIAFFNNEHYVIDLSKIAADDDLPQDSLRFELVADNDSLNIVIDPATGIATLTATGFSGTTMLEISVTDDSMATINRTIFVEVLNVVTGIEDLFSAFPDKFSISQNYPNPFNPVTKINYQLAKNSNVSLKVYDVKGREVAVIKKGFQTVGYYTIEFDGSSLASGLYFYRFKAGPFVKIKKMLLVK